jgi:sugar phosphate isomerase/epimerase
MTRRTFLTTTGAAAAFSASGGGIRLGFDSYSLRAFRWKAIELLDYAASQKLDTIQFSDLADYESLEPAYLQKVKDHAARLGIVIDSGLGCICPTAAGYNRKEGDPAQYVLRGLHAAKAVGSTSMRCYMGGGSERRGPVPIEQHIQTTVKILRSVRSQALDLGVKIAVENHMDLQAWELRELIEAAGKDFVGACFDTGNPISVAEDPMLALEVLAPYTVTTHVKDVAVWEHPQGAVTQGVALGESSFDHVAFFQRFRQLCPGVSVQLEVLTGSPPRVMPFLEPDFWKAFPKARACEFARFLALVKKGRPFLGAMMIAGAGPRPPEYEAALRQQQRVDLERSFEHARKVLDLGVRWRG